MAPKTVQLPRGSWTYDTSLPLGRPGGHAEVFAGASANGESVAVKRMKFDADVAANREIALASELFGKNLRHVIVPLDAGEDATSGQFYVIMPRADYSLEEFIVSNGPQEAESATAVLLDISRGLQELPQLVHRDIKPANVLWCDGRWCISDFGIAKLIDEATGSQTLFQALSPAYAAPEQWRGERTVPATDLYALGCVAHFVLTGRPPFPGPTFDEYRRQHLQESSSIPASCPPRLSTLISMLLRKPADSRPAVGRTIELLDQARRTPVVAAGDGMSRLSALIAADESAKAAAAAREAARKAELEQRFELSRAARQIAEQALHELFRAVESACLGQARTTSPFDWKIDVPGGQLSVEFIGGFLMPDEAFPHSKWDVVCGARIGVTQEKPKHFRTASLWYTRFTARSGQFRWYETAYIANPLSGKVAQFQPFACEPEGADEAHAPAMGVIQPAYEPVPIDEEHTEAFVERWLQLLAAAGEGRLHTLSTGLA